MKKAIIAIIAVVLAAALGTGAYFMFFTDKDTGAVTVNIDDFSDSPEILEDLMLRPERYTKVLENDYQLGTNKTAEFYECPEEWLTYSEMITIHNTTEETVTVYGLEISDNSKNGVYVSTVLDGEYEIESGGSCPVYFNILCDNGDLSTDEAKALVNGMDIKIVYAPVSAASQAEYKTADVNTATN